MRGWMLMDARNVLDKVGCRRHWPKITMAIVRRIQVFSVLVLLHSSSRTTTYICDVIELNFRHSVKFFNDNQMRSPMTYLKPSTDSIPAGSYRTFVFSSLSDFLMKAYSPYFSNKMRVCNPYFTWYIIWNLFCRRLPPLYLCIQVTSRQLGHPCRICLREGTCTLFDVHMWVFNIYFVHTGETEKYLHKRRLVPVTLHG